MQRVTIELGQTADGGGATLTFEARREQWPPPMPPPVVRREIRRMGRDDQGRFLAALRTMMQDDRAGRSGDESSEFFRIAGYHGWPGDGRGNAYLQREPNPQSPEPAPAAC